MQGMEIYDIIIVALAVFLGWRLFSVLGKRDEGDEAFTGLSEVAPPVAPPPRPAIRKTPEIPESLPAELRQGLEAIARADEGFDFGHFMIGARRAYAMIVDAFSDGDVATLKPFLGDDLYEAFASAIRSRGEGEAKVRVTDVMEAEALAAGCDGRESSVTIRFRSRQEHTTPSGTGMVEAVDIWTFRRLLRSRDPNWILVETRDAQ